MSVSYGRHHAVEQIAPKLSSLTPQSFIIPDNQLSWVASVAQG